MSLFVLFLNKMNIVHLVLYYLGFEIIIGTRQLTITASILGLLCAPLPDAIDKLRTKMLWIVVDVNLFHSMILPFYDSALVSIRSVEKVGSDALSKSPPLADIKVWLVEFTAVSLLLLGVAILCRITVKNARYFLGALFRKIEHHSQGISISKHEQCT